MGGVLQGIGSIAGPIISAFTQPSASGTSPAGALASGYLTSQGNKPQGQQYPGAFTPKPGQGLAYNYIPTGQPQFDVGFQNQSAYNAGSGLTAQELANPMAATLLQNQMNPVGAAGVMPAAQQAGQMAGQAGQMYGQAGQMASQAGQNAFGTGGTLNAAMLSALPQFQNILAMGMDPQGALYQRTQQQVADQLNAQAAQSGLGGSGVGMGTVGQGLSNFNIDWQNQQLARALSALQGYGGAMGQAGNVLGQGANLQGGGAGLLGQGAGYQATGAQDVLAGGMMPYQAGQTVMGGQAQALNNYINQAGGTQGIGSDNLANMLRYLQVGQGANQLAGQAAQGGAATAGAQNAAAAGFLSPLLSSGISGIGQGLGQLYNYFANPSIGTSDPFSANINLGGTGTPVDPGFGTDPSGQITGNFASFFGG